MIKKLLLLVCVLSSFWAKSQNNHKHTFKYVNPKYSPNGQLILASAEGYVGLYILDAKTLQKKHAFLTESSVGYGAAWTSDSKSIVFREKKNYQFQTKKIDIQTGKISETSISPLLLSCKASIGSKDVAHLTANNLIQYGSKTYGSSGENYYHVISNANKTVFVAHLQSMMILIDTKNNQLIPLASGLANAISNDGNYIYFFRDYSNDGHYISNAELFVYDIKNQKEIQLTNTEDTFELWPDLSPDGKTLIYSDDKSGEIQTLNVPQEIK